MAVTAEQLEEMTVLELVNLKKELEERWGVSAAAAAPVAVAAGGGGGAAEPAEEQTAFDVVLTETGPNKIPVIKVIREITGLRSEGGQGGRRRGSQARQGGRRQGRGRPDQGQAGRGRGDASRSSNPMSGRCGRSESPPTSPTWLSRHGVPPPR